MCGVDAQGEVGALPVTQGFRGWHLHLPLSPQTWKVRVGEHVRPCRAPRQGLGEQVRKLEPRAGASCLRSPSRLGQRIRALFYFPNPHFDLFGPAPALFSQNKFGDRALGQRSRHLDSSPGLDTQPAEKSGQIHPFCLGLRFLG